MQLIFDVIQFFYTLVGDWGLAIIIVTIILRLILLPLTIKQMKSMADMQILAPKLEEIKNKYKDDPQKQQEAMMEFYANNKFNPLGGCLPILVQMPVFIALFQVLRAGHLPEDARFYNIITSLAASPSVVFDTQGIVAVIPYIILVILFGVLTMIPMLMQQMTGPNAQMTKIMGIMMAVMMMWFGWTSPAGVLLFWDASSVWGVVQQLVIMKQRKNEAEKEEMGDIYKPIEVDVVRREKKPRPKKKGKQ